MIHFRCVGPGVPAVGGLAVPALSGLVWPAGDGAVHRADAGALPQRLLAAAGGTSAAGRLLPRGWGVVCRRLGSESRKRSTTLLLVQFPTLSVAFLYGKWFLLWADLWSHCCAWVAEKCSQLIGAISSIESTILVANLLLEAKTSLN